MTSRREGFTMVEALGALAITTTLLTAVLLLLQPTLDDVARVPEASDLHERGRAADAVIRAALEFAGSGADLLGEGPLSAIVPAVWPRRLGRWAADADGSAWADRFTAIHVPWLAAQAPLSGPVPAGSTDVTLGAHVACGTAPACGFATGDHVALIEATGAAAFAAVAGVAPATLHLDAAVPDTLATPGHAAAIEMAVLYFDAARRQVRRYDGLASDQPVVDDVVWMGVRYYADPLPPRRPALAGADTCVVDALGVPRLPLLGPVPAPLVELSPADLSDGPWCGRAPWRFDADLLRVRAVRVALRLQAASAAVRGVGLDFQQPGAATRAGVQVRDLPLDVFVTPRVLAGGG